MLPRCFFLVAVIIFVLFPLLAHSVGTTCSTTFTTYTTPLMVSQFNNLANGNNTYPDDFATLNYRQWYTCPTSGLRVVLSNGIPDHDVEMINGNQPADIPWAVQMPLTPSWITNAVELQPLGIMAISLNGVPIFGAQDNNGFNAGEPTDPAANQDGHFYWGHADPEGFWHYHNPASPYPTTPSDTTLLGYALDGYPIYGPVADNVPVDLCNGRTVSGNYQYHTRLGSQVNETSLYCNGTNTNNLWNYILGCYHGNLSLTAVTARAAYTVPSDCILDTVMSVPFPTASVATTVTVSSVVSTTTVVVASTTTAVSAVSVAVAASAVSTVVVVSTAVSTAVSTVVVSTAVSTAVSMAVSTPMASMMTMGMTMSMAMTLSPGIDMCGDLITGTTEQCDDGSNCCSKSCNFKKGGHTCGRRKKKNGCWKKPRCNASGMCKASKPKKVGINCGDQTGKCDKKGKCIVV